MMTLVEKYKKYRNKSRELNDKIITTSLNFYAFMGSAALLGFFNFKDANHLFLIKNKEELDILTDFALYEYKVEDKNIISSYYENFGWEDEMEREILTAFLSSYTSLFKVTSILKSESTLILKDILNKKDNINLIDIAMSRTTFPGVLLFTRIVPFDDFNMTSGIGFIFPNSLEGYILKRYREQNKRDKLDIDSMNRFIFFFELYKTNGLEVNYII
jgi:amino acid permease